MSDFFLADDLSGAFDAGAAFLRVRSDVRIVLDPSGWMPTGGPGIVGFTTETRNAPPAHAVERVLAAIAAGTKRGGRLVYKKIDSTLRGPVAAELGALQDAMPKSGVLFAPANPRVGRTVVDGVLLVRGVPVAETEFGRDPVSPLRHSKVRDILGATASDRVVIPDIAVEDDFASAATAMDRRFDDWVGVGSGALAAIAASRLSTNDKPSATGRPGPFSSGVLLIGGSAHPLNHPQALCLARECSVSVWHLDDARTAVTGAAADLQRSGVAIICAPMKRIGPAACLARIVDSSVELIETLRVGRVLVTGGETAFAVCARLGVRSMRLLAEVEPGLILADADYPSGRLLLAIKPGGFGNESSWSRAWAALKEF